MNKKSFFETALHHTTNLSSLGVFPLKDLRLHHCLCIHNNITYSTETKEGQSVEKNI